MTSELAAFTERIIAMVMQCNLMIEIEFINLYHYSLLWKVSDTMDYVEAGQVSNCSNCNVTESLSVSN